MARSQPWVAPALSFAQLISWGSIYYGFALLAEPMAIELGWSRTAVAGAFSLGLLAAGVFAVPTGMLIDRGHARALMAGGSALAAVLLWLFARVDGLPGLYLIWLGLGAAMAATLYEPAFAVMVRAFPEDYRSRIAVITLLGGLASTVFWPLTAWLVREFGWRDALSAMAAMHLAICMPIHLGFVPTNATRQVAPRPPARSIERRSPDTIDRRVGRPSRVIFLLLVGSFAGNLLVTASIAAHLPSMLGQVGLATATVLAIVAIIGPMQVAGRLLLILGEHRLSASTTTRLIAMLAPIGVLLFMLLALGIGSDRGGVPWLAIAIAFSAASIYGAGNGMLTIVKGTAVADLIGPARVATLNGIAAAPSAVARALGPVAAAWLWEKSDTPALPLACLFGVSLVAAWMLVRADRLGRRGRP